LKAFYNAKYIIAFLVGFVIFKASKKSDDFSDKVNRKTIEKR